MSTAEPYVVGSGMIDFGELYDQSFEDMLERASLDLIEDIDKGIDPKDDIDAIWYGTVDIAGEGMSGAAVSHATGLFEKPVTQIVNACATGSDAFRNAVMAVRSGQVDTAMVIGGEKMHDSTAGLIEAAATNQLWRGRGVTMPAFFGMRATRHMEEFGTTREQIAAIYDQLRGEAGEVQVNKPQIGLQHNIGLGRNATGSVSCVNILERENMTSIRNQSFRKQVSCFSDCARIHELLRLKAN